MNAISYLAPNLFWFYEAICERLARGLGEAVSLTQAARDSLDDPALRESQVDLAFICGLPFMRLRETQAELVALAAPVPAAPRYQDHPIYYADLIVRHDHPATTLDALRGSTFCYNDSGSNSGVHLLRSYFFKRGFDNAFFGRLVQSGSHQNSISMIIEGEADCATIDSLVLEQALRDDPQLSHQIRTISSIGPCPVPLLAVSTQVDIQTWTRLLLAPDRPLQAAMERAGIRRFAPVSAEQYAPIGTAFALVEAAQFQLAPATAPILS